MSGSIDELLEIMAALRDPKTGCPWDVEQDFSTIAPYTIEEAYEVDDAIQRGDMEDELQDAASSPDDRRHLEEELGDLLFASAGIACQHGLDPEQALRRANDKFEDRFRRLEALLRERHLEMEDVSIEDLLRHWEQAKGGR